MCRNIVRWNTQRPQRPFGSQMRMETPTRAHPPAPRTPPQAGDSAWVPLHPLEEWVDTTPEFAHTPPLPGFEGELPGFGGDGAVVSPANPAPRVSARFRMRQKGTNVETRKRWATDAAAFAADPRVLNWQQVLDARRHPTTRYMHVLKTRFIKQAKMGLPAAMPDGAVLTFSSVKAFEKKKAHVLLQWWHAAAGCGDLSDDSRVFARRAFVQNYDPGLFVTPYEDTGKCLNGPTWLLTYNGAWGS